MPEIELRPGVRLRSAACDTEVIVIRAPDEAVALRCGGHPMISVGGQADGRPAITDDAAGGTQLGKRYVDRLGTLEVLCTKPGEGSLAVDGTPLLLKEAKPLPASD